MRAKLSMKAIFAASLAFLAVIFLLAGMALASDISTSKPCSLKVQLPQASEEGTPPGIESIEVPVSIYELEVIAPNGEDLSVNERFKEREVGMPSKVEDYLNGDTVSVRGFADSMSTWVESQNEVLKASPDRGELIMPDRTGVISYGSPVEFSGLHAGVYLVMPDRRIYHGQYEYIFTPVTVMLPSQVKGNGDSMRFAYDVTMTLRPDHSDRMGSLEIVSNLPSFFATLGAQTFCFEVTATAISDGKDYKAGDVLYQNVVGMNMGAPGSQTLKLENAMQMNCNISVKCIYSGSCYEIGSSDVQEAQLIPDPNDSLADATAQVSFDFVESGNLNPGGGVINEYSKDDDGNWSVKPKYAV